MWGLVSCGEDFCRVGRLGRKMINAGLEVFALGSCGRAPTSTGNYSANPTRERTCGELADQHRELLPAPHEETNLRRARRPAPGTTPRTPRGIEPTASTPTSTGKFPPHPPRNQKNASPGAHRRLARFPTGPLAVQKPASPDTHRGADTSRQGFALLT